MKFIQQLFYLLAKLKKILFINLLVLSSFFIMSSSYAIDGRQIPVVKKVIDAFKANDRVLLSEMISYPLLRQAPLSPVNDKADFLNRYDDIFDQQILNIITQSNIYTDWDSVGWRGIILNNGILALDPEGNIIDVNYHSPREKRLVSSLTATQKGKGRSSLERNVNYNKALVEITTPHMHIRVDSLNESQGILRYSAWSVEKNTEETPDIVLDNGRVFSNSGRNQKYVFNNGTYQYRLNVISLGEDTMPTGSLEVFKNGEFLKREVATKVVHRN